MRVLPVRSEITQCLLEHIGRERNHQELIDAAHRSTFPQRVGTLATDKDDSNAGEQAALVDFLGKLEYVALLHVFIDQKDVIGPGLALLERLV